MGQPGDLLLIFADALTRSWKQVIKFRPEGTLARSAPPASPAAALPADPAEEAAPAPARDDGTLLAAGFVREERGLRFVGEAGD